MIRVYCEKADATLKETQTLTSGMTNYPTIVLTFSDDWNGFAKAAVVKAGDVTIDVLVKDNKFVAPAECFAEPGVNLIVGVSGTNGIQVIPTVWCSCGEILEGTDVNEGSNVGTATPSLVNQMLAYAQEAADAAAGVDVEAWARGTRNGVPVPTTDETYHNNAKYYCDTALVNSGFANLYIDDSTGHLMFQLSPNLVTEEET